MTRDIAEGPRERRHSLVERVLRSNIASGRLLEGLVLLEGPIADLLQTSRAPVQKALQTLEAEGLVKRFEGRGFLVGAEAADPLRLDLRQLGLVVSGDVDEALQSRGTWERIAEDVEDAVAACLVFGEYRIVETEIAAFFNVSRTVVRDLLGRLHERGLVRKNQSSHWIAGPLTAESLKERYEIRRILEPAALLATVDRLDTERLMLLRERAAAAELSQDGAGDHWDEIESAFMELSILRAPNRQLVEAIRHNQFPIRAASRLLGQLGLPSDLAAISESRMVIDLLLSDAPHAAAEFWRDHIDMASQRSIARLKIVAVIPEPQRLAPYLTPVR